jgi:hypothetical protein
MKQPANQAPWLLFAASPLNSAHGNDVEEQLFAGSQRQKEGEQDEKGNDKEEA